MGKSIAKRLTKAEQTELIEDISEHGKEIAFTKWHIPPGSGESLDKFLMLRTGDANYGYKRTDLVKCNRRYPPGIKRIFQAYMATVESIIRQQELRIDQLENQLEYYERKDMETVRDNVLEIIESL